MPAVGRPAQHNEAIRRRADRRMRLPLLVRRPCHGLYSCWNVQPAVTVIRPTRQTVDRMKAVLSCTLVLLAAGCFSGYESDGAARPDLRVRRGAFRGDVVITGELRAGRGDELVVPRLPQWQTSIKWMSPDGAEVKQGD